jgi:2-aminoadipate transaminase
VVSDESGRRARTSAALADRTTRLASSAIGSVLRLVDSPDVIALAAGSPAPETFCVDEVSDVVKRILSEPGTLQYGSTEGLWQMRNWLAADQSAFLGRQIDPADVTLTHGSQQALDLLCKAILDPGDVVLVDQPSYVGALQVLNLFQATIVPVAIAIDDNLDRLDASLRRGLRPKMAYVVPNFANPSGLTLSAHQRHRMVELSARHGFLVVEDDPYGELAYNRSAARPAALAALSDDVVRLGSFSKILFPAARLGYIIANPSLARVLQKLKQAADLGNSVFLETLVYELVRVPGFLPDRLIATRKLYRERRDSLVASLHESMGGQLQFSRPEGGFFIWAKLTNGVTATTLLGHALKERVSFVPGQSFFAADPDYSTLRLSFSCAAASRLTAAGPRLARALERVSQ